jgi:threonine dehydrogenase-like Zn-dependent dehydrogenase
VFHKARAACGERICAAYECTGQERVLEAAIESRFLRGESTFIGLGCHYQISFDKAALRRDECSLVPVRRSRDKFPTVLDFLGRHADLFDQLVGSIVKFDNLPEILTRRGGTATGSGGPKVVVEF